MKHTEETKKKIKEHNAKYWSGKKLTFTVWNKGKNGYKVSPRSEEGKNNMKKAWVKMKENGAKPPTHNTPHSAESKKLMSESHLGKMRGKLSPHWKGGLTSLFDSIRKSFKYRQWISDVFSRDDFTCQKCFNRGGKLNAHHKKALSIIIRENNIKIFEEAEICEELWNINNGITLCLDCHKKTDSYGFNFKKNNTQKYA